MKVSLSVQSGQADPNGRPARLSCFLEIFEIRRQSTIVILKKRNISESARHGERAACPNGQVRGFGGLPTNKQKDFLYRKALLAKERISGIVTLDLRHALSENPRLKMCARHRDIRINLKINFLERTRKCRKAQRK